MYVHQYRYLILVSVYQDEVQKTKVKVTMEQATNSQNWSRRIAQLVLQPTHRMRVVGQRHPSAALPLEKDPVPIEKEVR
jgi:hypothetical protein